MDIARLPEILTFHLKRFDFIDGELVKIEDLVDFPLKNLRLCNYVLDNSSESKNTYDLYGVGNHIQFSVAGGHYTSYIQYNPEEIDKTTPKVGENWYIGNDEKVKPISKADVVDKDAFILFYKRHEFNSSNIVDFLAF